jgi:hypothetical protein
MAHFATEAWTKKFEWVRNGFIKSRHPQQPFIFLLLLLICQLNCSGRAGKKGGAILFTLIFFVSFLYQDKKENRHYKEANPIAKL